MSKPIMTAFPRPPVPGYIISKDNSDSDHEKYRQSQVSLFQRDLSYPEGEESLLHRRR
jgi:hypothetical protein